MGLNHSIMMLLDDYRIVLEDEMKKEGGKGSEKHTDKGSEAKEMRMRKRRAKKGKSKKK